MSKLYEHACKLYEALETESENGLYSGRKTVTFYRTGISQAHYSKVFNLLTETGCIEQVRRGDMSVPTLIRLHHAPIQEAVDSVPARLTKPGSHDNLRQRVEVIERRLPDIDLKAYIKSLESRLADIEAKLER
jgi:hypothetical protein